MQTFIIERTATTVTRFEVTAASLVEAMRNADERHVIATTAATPQWNEIAAWPAGSAMEEVLELPNGYRVRRGWFWEISLDYRSVSLLDADIFPPDAEIPSRIPREMFKSILHMVDDGNETIFSTRRVFGYAGSHGDLKTWGAVCKEPKEALRATRKYVEKTRAQTRDRQRREREEAAEVAREGEMLVVLQHMLETGGRLVRYGGGLWSGADMNLTEGAPACSWDRGMSEDLVRHGYATVTDRMNKSGEPRILTISAAGCERVETQRKLETI